MAMGTSYLALGRRSRLGRNDSFALPAIDRRKSNCACEQNAEV